MTSAAEIGEFAASRSRLYCRPPHNLPPCPDHNRPERPSVPAMNSHAKIDSDRSPILIVPYMWIGDFVRCHSVVKLLNARFPNRPVDVLTTSLCAPLTDYMPGLRRAVVVDLPRSREISAGAISCRNTRTHRLFWRGPFCSAQRFALRRTKAAAHGGSLCRLGVARRGAAPG